MPLPKWLTFFEKYRRFYGKPFDSTYFQSCLKQTRVLERAVANQEGTLLDIV